MHTTTSTNKNAIRVLARFVIDAEYKSRFFDSDPHRKSYVSENPDRLSEFEVEQLRKELFKGCIAGEEVPEDVQYKVQRYLIKFAVGYRSSGTNSEVMPTTMKTYILGISASSMNGD